MAQAATARAIQHRAELVAAGAIGLVAGRMVAFLPRFDEMIVKFAREAVGSRLEERHRVLDAAISAVLASSNAVKED
jgi:hypothetical protein